MPQSLRILCFGAHPDDCDFYCGWMTLMWRDMGPPFDKLRASEALAQQLQRRSIMTHKERILAACRGEVPDCIPWIPRLDLWHNAHRRAGTLPRVRIAGE